MKIGDLVELSAASRKLLWTEPFHNTIGIVTRVNDVNTPVDLLIDFTLPGGTRVAADWCERNGVPLLSGTTGLQDEDLDALNNAAMKVPVLWAPNLSHGVALMAALVNQAANGGLHASRS